MDSSILPGLPVDLIRAAYLAAPGNEIESGKFASPESSAALVANAFGLFLDRPIDLPPIPGTANLGWPARSVGLEVTARFPWAGGRSPCLDVLIATETTVIGVESKRYEPFRAKSMCAFSDAYWRPVWGDAMGGYERVRDELSNASYQPTHLDAGQLVKHAFGLRTAVSRRTSPLGKRAFLVYLYAEPMAWPDGRPILNANLKQHRSEIAAFANIVSRDEVGFLSCSYSDLLASWSASPHESVRHHASAVAARFNIEIFSSDKTSS